MTRNWLRSLFARSGSPHRRQPLRLAVEVLEDPAVPATLVVDINNPDANLPGDSLYAEIQEAVDAASPGDLIKVHGGTYAPVTITKDSLTIQEANANSNPVVDAAGGIFGVKIDANGVTVRGLEARNATGGEDEARGFFVTGNNNTLIGNAASGNVHGFGIIGGDGNRLVGNTSSGNEVGFEMVFGADDNTFTNNTANGNSFHGFFVLESSDNTFISNTAIGNDAVGFFIVFCEGTTLTGNRADGNSFDGYNLLGSAGLTLTGNTASDNGRDGFRLRAVESSTFTGNTADGNGGNGFSVLLESTGNVFTGNAARDNAGRGIFLDDTSLANLFRGTVLSGNGNGDSNVPLS
jgi:parallel beta-helix repeat protein